MAGTEHREQNTGETGYSWLFFPGGHAWYLRLVVILVVAVSIACDVARIKSGLSVSLINL